MATRGVRRAALPRVSEKVEQAHIVQLARSLGAFVVVLGTVRRGSRCRCGEFVRGHMGTQQTPGVADLEIFMPTRVLPGGRFLLKWETKAADGRLSPEQIAYRDHCVAAGVEWGSGTFDAFRAALAKWGYLKGENVPHYVRQEGAGDGR